jgi:hypothetical protein
LGVAKKVEGLIIAMLKTNNIKNWFRAYLNLGLIEKILGHDRLIPCTAGSDFAFIDPWSDVWACNVRSDLPMGNLARQSWDDILNGEVARKSRASVAACPQNCWMVTTARTAMRSTIIPQAPKMQPLLWVLNNKLRVSLGMDIRFDDYIDYRKVAVSPQSPRVSYLDTKEKGRLVKGRTTVDQRYPLKDFVNK